MGYTSWGAYFEAEFGQSRRRGYQLLEAGRVLVPVQNCSLTPANEAQARELAPLLDQLGEQAVVEVWDGLVDEHGPEITAKLVRDAVRAKLKPPEVPKTLDTSQNGATPSGPQEPRREVDQLGEARKLLSQAYAKAALLVLEHLEDHPEHDREAACKRVAHLSWRGLVTRVERLQRERGWPQ